MVGIIITTRNRAEDLATTLRKIQTLAPAPDEVIITADGCTDDTVQVVNKFAPEATLIVNQSGVGSVASRDRMLREARSDYLLSLDDDSYPIETDFLGYLPELFATYPNAAVISFPQRTDEFPESVMQADFGLPIAVGSYANSGACYRREWFGEFGGFEGAFYHAYEEPDYALRCVANGRMVLFWPRLTIRHHYSNAGRKEILTHHRHSRNELWSTLLRCPLWLIWAVIPYRILSQGRYAMTKGADWLRREPEWWLSAWRGWRQIWTRRAPVGSFAYMRWIYLSRQPRIVSYE